VTEIELRPYAGDDVEVRAAGDGKLVLSGTAIRYGARSRDFAGFRERIMPGAAVEAMQKGDVRALEEHRLDRYLGRTGNGTLRLLDGKDSLRYEVDLPDTAAGREVAALAGRGDYKGSSFGFKSAAATWTKDTDGTPLRTITAFKLLRDVGPTVDPAYDTGAAEAALRNFADEAQVEVELRNVIEAAKAGRLADLLDRAAELRHGDELDEEDPQTPPLHRRPPHWFV
jgi:uncharacterized protein